VTEEALTFITTTPLNDATQQEKLASLIDSAFASHLLTTAVKSIKSPLPVLAMSIVEALRRGQGHSAVLDFLETYKPPELPNPSRKDHRTLLWLKGEQADCSSRMGNSDFGKFYEQAIDQSMQDLGVRDATTTRLRYAYAQELRLWPRRKADAIVVCLEILRDLVDLLEDSTDDLALAEAHLPSAASTRHCMQKLVTMVQEMTEIEHDETVRAEVESFLPQAISLCAEQATPNLSPEEGHKRKADALNDKTAQLTVRGCKRAKMKPDCGRRDGDHSDKENDMVI
jgi:hypothetical protein